MSTLRRLHDTTGDPADAARAARRLAGVALRPAPRTGADAGPHSGLPDPDDPGGGYGDPYDGPDGDRYDGRPVGPDGFDWFVPGPPPDGVADDALVPRGSTPADRLRDLAGGRAASLRGAAGVPVTAAIAVVLVVAAVVAGVLLRAGTSRPQVVDVSGRTVPATAAAAAPTGGLVVAAARPSVAQPVGVAGAPTSGAASGPVAVALVVDVVGKVRRPGLVRLPAGSRVADAIAAAGGPTDRAALPRINLARPLSDGEQVVVPDADDPLPAPVPAPAGPGGPSGTGTAASGPLDLNAATAADLDGLPGVGPVIAGRIVAWRAEHQRFTRVDELAEVAGIGDRMLERLRPLVRV